MSTQMLIYETAFPVSAGRHGATRVEATGSYAFSAKVNSVPLMAVEFAMAASEYAIIFAGEGDAIMPAAALGMRGNENAYLDAQGGWQAKYIPAFIRRYPFVFASEDDGQRLTLCIDEAYPGCKTEGPGERLFTDEGKPTPYVDSVLAFLQSYQAEFVRSQAFCRKLRALNLLEPMKASATLPSGESLSLTGFLAVSRERLKALPGDTLGELLRSDELELIYLHLASIRNFANMRDRLLLVPGGAPDGLAAQAEGAAQAQTLKSSQKSA